MNVRVVNNVPHRVVVGPSGPVVRIANAPTQRIKVLVTSGVGPQGPQGPPGVGLWSGAWSGATTYVVNALVERNGSSYISLQNGNLNHDPVGLSPWWALVAQKGAQGDPGVPGVLTFLALSDTPDTFVSHGGKQVRVNSGATALEFVAATLDHRHVWNEVPAGSLNGSNRNFTLAESPVPPASVLLFLNGLLQREGADNDFVLTGTAIAFHVLNVPQVGDNLLVSYTAAP